MLVAAAVDRAGREGLTIVPLCPFARIWLERHPDAAARVPVDWGRQARPD
jgi:predicted GNAT family acetyltransferase